MTAPKDQWWYINGAELLAALHQAHDGDAPDVVYLELIANSSDDTPTTPTTPTDERTDDDE